MDADWPAVVSSSDRPNGLGVIRSLGRRGIEVIAVDNDPRATGMNSRYARPVLAPHPKYDEPGFIATLLEVSEQLGRPAVFYATSDPALRAVASHHEQLGDRYVHPFPTWETLGDIQSKWFQIRRSAEAGIRVPRTVDAPTTELGFPVVVKPESPYPFRIEYPGVHAYLCRDLAEAKAAFARCAAYRPLVQEFVPGGDDTLYTFGTYISRDGEALGLFSGRKLSQTPPHVGSCRVAEAVWFDDVVEQGLAVMRAIGFHGMGQVEFKRDARDGRLTLMEVNPRPWNWHGLTGECGVDLTWIAYQDLTGRRPAPTRMTHEGKRWSITLLGSKRPAPQRPPYTDGVFAKDDVRPFVADLRHQARMGRRRLANFVRRTVDFSPARSS